VNDDETRGAAVADAFRRALRDTLLLLGVLVVLGTLVGWLVAGLPGVWGALIGVGLAGVFCTTTVIAVQRTLHSPPATMAAVVMGTWLAKLVVVVVVLAVLRPMDFYSAPVLGAVLAVGAVGSLALDARAMSRARVPYVEP
jgi:urea transporter